MASKNDVLELNVGGVVHSTTLETLQKYADSKLAKWFDEKANAGDKLCKDSSGRCFIDRDGDLFRYVLDFLRNGQLLVLPTENERERLIGEAEFFQLQPLVEFLNETVGQNIALPVTTGSSGSRTSSISNYSRSGYITVGYQGTFSFGRGMGADVNFRKVNRILICGRVGLCREVFGDSLNEGRDPDRGVHDRYTSRFYLKHSFIEQAFETLADRGFKLVTSCASGTSSVNDAKPGSNTEEERWAHYNEFIFHRE